MKRREIKIEMVPIEEEGVHLFIRGRINGKSARFLIDTGASRSVMDKDRVSRFFPGIQVFMEKLEQHSTGLGTSTMESNLVILPLLSFGRMLLRDYRMAALDMSHVNQSYALLGMKKIDGVIGGDILLRYGAVIDYRKQSLRLTANPPQ